jgi:inner membrane protein
VILAGLTLLFAVALVFIRGLVSERESYRAQVIGEVARSTAGDQTVTGPVLLVPYRERTEVAGTTPGSRVVQEVRGEAVLLPESLDCRTSIHVETRSRGIYSAPVYRAEIRLTGSFRIPAGFGLADTRTAIPGDPPAIVLGVGDMRGLRKPPNLRWNGAAARFTPGTGRPWMGEGLSAALPAEHATQARVVPFDVALELLGTDRFGVVPSGASTRVRMESDWPHPAFTGDFLPDTRTVGDRGFTAGWELSEYATGIGDAIARLRQGNPTPALGRIRAGRDGGVTQGNAQFLEHVAVRFVDPVDVYRQSQRATKYGLLFVLLTFAAFFLVEVLKRLAVHPVQYALAGAAVALFFMLLLSLAEYVAFAIAYLIASLACVALLAFYVGHVLQSARRGLGFAALLAALYGILYLLLQSEDYALLLGTLMLFAVLAVVMVLTRRVDWYRMGEAAPSGPPR